MGALCPFRPFSVQPLHSVPPFSLPPPATSSCCGRLFVNCHFTKPVQAHGKGLPALLEELKRERRTVGVFWDLDNKPPNFVEPYDAAVRLRTMAGGFGEVVDIVAYANSYAFKYVPSRVREERQDRKALDLLEKKGILKPEQPYVCTFCGRKFSMNLKLKKHFKQLHEREREKRLNRLGSLKGKRRATFKEKILDKEQRYAEAAKAVIVPKVGYGLASELRRAGVSVRTVDNKPQAADEALKKQMTLHINRGIQCVFLVSDDLGFMEMLKAAQAKHLYTVVVGDCITLKRYAHTSFSWEDLASGKAKFSGDENFKRWCNERDSRIKLTDNVVDEHRCAIGFPPESEEREMYTTGFSDLDSDEESLEKFSNSRKVSAFGEEDEEEEELEEYD